MMMMMMMEKFLVSVNGAIDCSHQWPVNEAKVNKFQIMFVFSQRKSTRHAAWQACQSQECTKFCELIWDL